MTTMISFGGDRGTHIGFYPPYKGNGWAFRFVIAGWGIGFGWGDARFKPYTHFYRNGK